MSDRPANFRELPPQRPTFAPFSDEQLQALEARWSRIAVVTGKAPKPRAWVPDDRPEPPWQAVFREPVEGETSAYEGAANNPSQAAGALRTFARTIVVAVSLGGVQTIHAGDRRGPEEKAVRAAWDELKKKYTGAHLAAQDDIAELLGMAREEAGKD